MSLAASILLALLAPASARAVTAPALGGEWVVDLSGKPDQLYTKPMALVLAADGTVTGSFYDSPIQAGRWKTDRGRTCASFSTSDGLGPYHTSACLVGDSVQGQTWAEHRKFVFNWNAVRK
ncbi:MAG TPA: hypothetical protein VEZ70_02710 [Allosphingosinicella sp.]|nr:hypothetical protein [Allosphingosinicella sp.]